MSSRSSSQSSVDEVHLDFEEVSKALRTLSHQVLVREQVLRKKIERLHEINDCRIDLENCLHENRDLFD